MNQSIGNSLISNNYLQGTVQQVHHEKHISYGQYLKSIVYGGLDGTVNTLAVILGGIASGAEPSSILAIGISVLIGDGLGMGLGDYLSSKSSDDFIKTQRKRQEWQFQHEKEVQLQEVKQIYLQKGYSQKESKRLVELLASNSKVFVNVMMLQQLGLVQGNTNPLLNGVITFASFVVMGLLPLIPYIIQACIDKYDEKINLITCLIIATIQLFVLGYAKAALAQLNKFKSGFETLIFGGLAVAAGYGVGTIFRQQ